MEEVMENNNEIAEKSKEMKKKLLDVKAERNLKVSDEEMEKVAGGYLERNGYAWGYNISCPRCRRSEESNFETWIYDDVRGEDGFRCRNCGYTFTVDYYGNMYQLFW